jgi:hypothetical protein
MHEELFYGFRLERHVPASPLLRAIARFVDLSGIREHLPPFTVRSAGPPSPRAADPMLTVGYWIGIRSERRPCEACV